MTIKETALSFFTVSIVFAAASGCAGSNATNTRTPVHGSPHDESKLASSGASIEIKDLDTLQEMLLDQLKRDQKLREEYSKHFTHSNPLPEGGYAMPENGNDLLKQLFAVDNESTELLKAMVEKFGWPSYDMIGKDACTAAWLLAQHADAQPEFQERVLALMEPLVKQSQADSKLFAMLTDRVLMNKKEPQIYGTQFIMDDSGVLRPVPIEDFEHIDARRAEAGFGTLKEYAALLSSTSGTQTKTTPLDEYPVYAFSDSDDCESDDFHNHP